MPGGRDQGRAEVPGSPPRTAEDLCDLLDEALRRIARSAHDTAQRTELAEHVAGCLRAVYDGLALSGDAGAYRDALVIASMQLESATAAIAPLCTDPELAKANAALLDAHQLLERGPSPARGWRFPSVSSRGGRVPASVGSLRLLDPSREVVMPAVPLAPERIQPVIAERPASLPEPVRDLADLDLLLAEAAALPVAAKPARIVAPAPAKAPLPARSATESMARRARVLVEELGCLGAQRRPRADRSWLSNRRVEERLLARVDALVACGEHVLPVLVRGLENRQVPDPELTWALVLVFSTLAGDDSLDEAIRIGRATDLSHPGVRAAFVDALALAPTSRVEGRLRPWLSSADDALRTVAVTVLGRRAALLPDELTSAAADGCLSVVEAAAACVGSMRGAVLDATLVSLLDRPEESVVGPALAGSVALRHPVGVAWARDLVRAHRGDFAGANVAYALCAGRSALNLLLEDSAVEGGANGLTGLGWFGHLGAVPYLIGRLDSHDAAIGPAAAMALQRISGLGDPVDDTPSLQPTSIPTQDVDRWRSWWATRGRDLDPTVRFRFGRPWRATMNLEELRGVHGDHAARTLCALELRARMALTNELDLHSFVAMQLLSLDALEGELRASELPQTGWPVSVWV
ncbi:MAG: hypothetical protein KC619_22730 [Myxococcales bacterium]|nr:hypothetical protein [Myxococcales bacterium]